LKNFLKNNKLSGGEGFRQALIKKMASNPQKSQNPPKCRQSAKIPMLMSINLDCATFNILTTSE
jgi:hypothetical protein